MTITELVEASYMMAKLKGFHDDAPNIPEKLALIHSEVSEALEEVRKGELPVAYTVIDGKPEGFAIELADVVIRVADLCGVMGLDLETAIQLKMRYNATREHKHGKRF